MKKFFASFFVLFLVFSQTACTIPFIQSENSTSVTQGQTQSQTKRVARKVDLVRMSEEDFKMYLPHAVDEYAKDLIKSGTHSPYAAKRKASQDYADNLPLGLKTEGQFLTSIVDQDTHEKVGILYYIRSDVETVFIYDIEIIEGKRGGGYGTASMLALENKVKPEGVSKIELHVFNHNPIAIGLYKKLGYIKVRDSNMGGMFMEKRL